jgi:hypothetical protein
LTPLVVGLLSLLLYTSSLERPPHNDELYHMLAAHGLIETGEPAIGETGRYTRGYPTTWLVAQSIQLFGPGLASGRLPSVVFMVGLVVLMFLFLRREAGSLAAWFGAGLFAVSPFAIDMAQFVRFYSMQGFCFFAAAWIVYHLVGVWSWRRPWHWLLAVAATLLLVFTVDLQVTTMLGIAGIAVWAVAALLLPFLASPDHSTRLKVGAVGGLAALAVAALLVLVATGRLAELWAAFRYVPIFNQPNADRFWFYHSWYVLYYPTLWTLVGVLTVLALIERTRPASFALAVFAVGFLLNSFAGPKSLRYIFYAQPFLFLLWGMGLAAAIRWMRESALVAELERRLQAQLTLLDRRWAALAARALVIGAVAFVILANPAWLRSVTLLAGITVPPELPPVRWAAAEPSLRPWLDEAEVVVVAEELNPLYFYGRADVLLNPSRYDELPEDIRQPFTPDQRTSVPSIPDAASLAKVMDCHADGLFLIEEQFWGPGARTLRDPAVEELLIRRAERIDLPPETQLIAFAWTTSFPNGRPASCAELPTVTEEMMEGADGLVGEHSALPGRARTTTIAGAAVPATAGGVMYRSAKLV